MALSQEASARGIRRGMTLTQARALFADIAHADYQPDRDRHALEALGRWMMRFSPVVSCGTREDTSEAHCLFLDISGCDRVFGGFENLIDGVSDALERLGISARVAAAPTPGAAWALASAGRHKAFIEEHRLESALDPLPVECLRIGEDVSASLKHLGLHTIGQVMYLPREVLPARFGSVLLRRVDQALGRLPEPLVPLEYRTPVEARLDWDGAVGSLESIWSVFKQLIGQVIDQLVRRGQGARRVEVELLRLHSPAIKKTIFLSRPSRDPVNLFNLFRCAIEELQLPLHERSRLRAKPPHAGGRAYSRRPGSSVREQKIRGGASTLCPGVVREAQVCDEGFSGMRIAVPLCERLTDEQIALLEHEQYAGQAELDRLIERLRVRMGTEVISQVELVETYVPEAAWSGSLPASLFEPEPQSRRPRPGVPASSSAVRPLHLFDSPTEVRVMVTPSEDAEGHPAAFTHGGVVRQVTHCVGPERIAGRWWNGNDKTRDYFDVADATGLRFWMFRVGETGRWYLHGIFE